MKYTLRRPCKSCPFRTDVEPFLHPERVEEILGAMFEEDKNFACHNTVSHDSDTGEGQIHANSQHCAGAMILMERNDYANQGMRIAERLGFYDRSKLCMGPETPVYQTPDEMIAAHEQAERTTINRGKHHATDRLPASE